jgi:hypothetical protein
MHSKTHTRAVNIVDQALRQGPWKDTPWDERSRRFGGALLTGLRESLATLQPMNALASACTAAKGELPLASATFHETWSRVTLVWAVREIVRAAHAESDTVLRDELLKIAAELAAASAQLGSLETAGTTTQPPFEQMVDTARDAFNRTKDALQVSNDERAFLSAYVHQLKHIASLLAVGGHSVDSLVRGAVTRTDRVVRRDGMTAWIEAPLGVRQTWMQRGLVEAAWALASQVSREQGKDNNSRDVCLWLSRTACQLVARIDRVDAWVPVVAEDASPASTPAPSTPATRSEETNVKATSTTKKNTEKPMDNAKLTPTLKTLEVDATDAAWRMAGSQFIKLAKEPIVALLSRHLGPDDESMRAKIAAFLDTELGTALLSSLLSVGLSALPLPPNDVSQRLSRELRIAGMARAGDAVADVLMGPLRQVAVMYLQGVPTTSEPAALPGNASVEQLKVNPPGEQAEVVVPVASGAKTA